MKIKFQLGDGLPLGKTFDILDMIIFAASVLERNSNYYPQFFFYTNTHISYKNVTVRKN